MSLFAHDVPRMATSWTGYLLFRKMILNDILRQALEEFISLAFTLLSLVTFDLYQSGSGVSGS